MTLPKMPTNWGKAWADNELKLTDILGRGPDCDLFYVEELRRQARAQGRPRPLAHVLVRYADGTVIDPTLPTFGWVEGLKMLHGVLP